MKIGFLLLILLALTTSCKNFELEKISSEEFLEEELKSITWNEVDTYPNFPNCKETLEKIAQKECFETTLLNHFHNQLLQKELISTTDLSDTVLMTLKVNHEGKITLAEIAGDTITFAKLPELKLWLQESVTTLPLTQAALKRGIPVNTQFTLPLVLKTEALTN
ncbi:MAG: hypothetical protein COZ75_10595 [Flavobacteriaceae bacterium CG_4_8_14_3_um_filter_34_10]|nr:hypothetical protein [Flavobacteriia bacterium]OIP50930.1 MAG: hypothetical protein AUK33_06050 [Flavobacteriaceae bacterium CG2_30_34_30]PIQ18139.1 MAG: hypothetical protein COW66_07970 [Flavobacteriaceae bacterium CG18_big_fil_WC_8_21_14_2_50_34_36]PIV48942.1 MAG: hypothetical protein COS19_11250 [Flavobacteriaceae bacterium CG02_land_8_20_14_3_00_34_13]PIX08702.1 MAG: hypothetical protein COZ75_10595 [Flavobacteriaceae bacterium CG_4_8_14_3_um_filter_34_10]PIZ08302.1 MAG: hypothetical pr